MSTDGSLLNNIDKLIAVADTCDLCVCVEKREQSFACGSVFRCGRTVYIYNKTEMLLDCDALEKYAQLIDIIFSVKYIERAFELKTIIDNTILSLHPHMCYPINWYDTLLYRFYCSPWVIPKGFHLEEGEVVNEEDSITLSLSVSLSLSLFNVDV